MCGIVGYAGKQQAGPVLIDGLSRLEYRGYDSAGICVFSPEGLQVEKAKGRLQVLRQITNDGHSITGNCGIGHTRWATHGAPSDTNSHPHLSDSRKIALVHNGIIENELQLRSWLTEKGIRFQSETDTEVIANLIGYYYEKGRDLTAAVRQALVRLEGSFALGILCADLPGTVVAVKKDSPLIFGFGEGENFIASDVPAILKHTNTVAYLNDGEMVVFTKDAAVFLDCAGEKIQKKRETVTWALADAQKGGYETFMLKEIMEQPKALRDTVFPRVRDGEICFEGLELPEDFIKKLRRVTFIGCGSAYYVGVLAKYTAEKICGIPAEAVFASEFRYGDTPLGQQNLVVFISQSGETADTLAALKEAKARGARTLAIVNVVGSAIAKAADQVIYTWAGPEISVATTKAFSTQLTAVYLLTLEIAKKRNFLSPESQKAAIDSLMALPEAVEQALSGEMVELCQYFADRCCGSHDCFYIGRNLDSAICLEGSLKLKEIAYLHSEAYPAGELKHGPISLIQDGSLVIALATQEELFGKMLANIREVRARGAQVLCITLDKLKDAVEKVTEHIITVPQVHPMLQPSLSLLPLQLFAYYVAVNRGCDVDKPRNLAKSVTVE